MIYTKNEKYRVKFYEDIRTKKSPVLEYIYQLKDNEQSKIFKYIEFLKDSRGYLDEPYSKHIRGKIRELRVDFGKSRHRVFYFIFIEKNIIFLHAFLKKTSKTPDVEIKRAEENYKNFINNYKL